MADEHPSGNPYDFRSPVRHSTLLAGRDEELAEIDELLRETASGNRVHFSLFGGEGSGKSSLLNGVADLARDRGFLAVKLPLREALVESELDFYRAVYDAALQALLDAGQLTEEATAIRAWVVQTCTGVLPPGMDKEPFELGLLVSARMNGRMVSSVPTQLVERDLKRLLSVSSERMQGIVLCLDRAELLDDNLDLGPSLLQLADATPLLTIVTAAEAAGSLQQAAPRAWAQIEVAPLRDPGDILDAITKPVDYFDDAFGSSPPTPATAMDIRDLTGGVPYEIMLVCHFIWDAIQQGEQENFELSPAVIERVTAELEEKGRHQASPEIATFSVLSESDYRLLVELAPYEALTVRQLALLRLMLDDYGESDLEAAEASIRLELGQLEEKGAVRVERDRFEVLGGRDGRLYLKYAAKRHIGRKLRYGDSYARAATIQCATHFGRALVGERHGEARIVGRGRPHEVGGSAVGRWLDSIVQAAGARDIVTLSEELGPWFPLDRALQYGDNPFILFGLQLQVGLHDIEHVELLANVEARPAEDVEAAAERLVADHNALLAKYDVRVVAWHCEEISSQVLRTALVYWQLRLICQVSYVIYQAGAAEVAEALVGSQLDAAEKLVGPDPADPLLRTQFANALNRLGFMAATRGAWDAALDRLERSRAMALTDEWLLDYNTAYVVACRGDLAGAITLATSAVNGYDNGADLMVLHAYLPTPTDWTSPNEQWNVVELQRAWIKRFLELQLLVLRAAESPENRQPLKSALDELIRTAPPPLLRLAGWAQLGILGRADEAAKLFARAVVATPYDAAEVPQLELAYAEALVSAASAAATDSSALGSSTMS